MVVGFERHTSVQNVFLCMQTVTFHSETSGSIKSAVLMTYFVATATLYLANQVSGGNCSQVRMRIRRETPPTSCDVAGREYYIRVSSTITAAGRGISPTRSVYLLEHPVRGSCSLPVVYEAHPGSIRNKSPNRVTYGTGESAPCRTFRMPGRCGGWQIPKVRGSRCTQVAVS
jgi:hypothetical protein